MEEYWKDCSRKLIHAMAPSISFALLEQGLLRIPRLRWKHIAFHLSNPSENGDTFKLAHYYGGQSIITIGHFRPGGPIHNWIELGTAIFRYGNWMRGGQGRGLYLTEDGYSYRGEFENGIQKGHGEEITRNGIKFEGNFYFQVRVGQGTITYPDGFSFTSFWQSDNQPNGAPNHPEAQKCIDKKMCTRSLSKVYPQNLMYVDGTEGVSLVCEGCANNENHVKFSEAKTWADDRLCSCLDPKCINQE
eukprot:TRINITY_DN8967_c0_g1_i1.p1 TRINITY_DN8967_c0_g1~~TRINITY_DN8967_c0_g1_i1.p1  ORF type:complete len:283 (+),score=64.85 TRINITY_DN8967_c0_g1_i1:113-850(+)